MLMAMRSEVKVAKLRVGMAMFMNRQRQHGKTAVSEFLAHRGCIMKAGFMRVGVHYEIAYDIPTRTEHGA
jgi:hypothetical protein